MCRLRKVVNNCENYPPAGGLVQGPSLSLRDEQHVWGRPFWGSRGMLVRPYTLLYLPGHSSYNAGGWQDRERIMIWLLCGKLTRKCVRLDILRPQAVGENEVESTQEHDPACLP